MHPPSLITTNKKILYCPRPWKVNIKGRKILTLGLHSVVFFERTTFLCMRTHYLKLAREATVGNNNNKYYYSKPMGL